MQAYAAAVTPAPSPADAPERRRTVGRPRGMQAKADVTLRRLEEHDRAQGQA